MDQILQQWHLLGHPFYQDWMEGKLSREQLRDYSRQYYHHVSAFPRYLSAMHSIQCNAKARRILLENLNDEEGLTHGEAHPELWRKFALGLGVTERELENEAPRAAITHVRENFFQAARQSPAAGLGALYAYEWQVPEIAESKIRGLRERYGVEAEETLAFFTVHREADQHHRAVLRELLDSLTPEEKEEARASAERAARALWDFLSEVHERGSSPGDFHVVA
jgi:pyrroloquinoline-quinone synthase